MPVIVGVPLLDLRAQFATIKEEVEAQISEVLESQQFVLGPKVKEFEGKAAAACEVKHAIGVASGSDALLLALMAVDVEPGTSVISTPYSFVASCSCVTRLGARPIFCDIEPDTYNLDPKMVAEMLERDCERTSLGIRHRSTDTIVRALMPVHLYGQCADMTAFSSLAERHGLAVVEDAAQAIGARHRGRQAGTIGSLGGFSFYPSKNLGAYGDGGMVTTQDDELAQIVRMLRDHGSTKRYEHECIGINSRLDSIQAAVLLAKLPHLAEWNADRRRRAEYYGRALSGVRQAVTPVARPENECTFHQYVIRIQDRDRVAEHLRDRHVGHAIYYPTPLHLQPCFSYLGHKQGDFPIAEQAARETLALPIYPELSTEQQDYVVAAIRECYAA
jgi:dTDP-4-amino-4,6-dideoxygalactose transaminase